MWWTKARSSNQKPWEFKSLFLTFSHCDFDKCLTLTNPKFPSSVKKKKSQYDDICSLGLHRMVAKVLFHKENKNTLKSVQQMFTQEY